MGTQKPLLPWPPEALRQAASGTTLLSSLIAALLPFTDTVIVVVGKNDEQLAPVIQASGAFLVENPEPECGQFSSLRVGLRELLERQFTAAMICPVDSPPLSDASLRKLCDRFRSSDETGRWGVAPRNGDQRGHPLLAGRELIDAFLNSPADTNAKAIKRAHEDRIEYVEIADPFIGLNLNTPEEYAELCRSTVALRTKSI